MELTLIELGVGFLFVSVLFLMSTVVWLWPFVFSSF